MKRIFLNHAIARHERNHPQSFDVITLPKTEYSELPEGWQDDIPKGWTPQGGSPAPAPGVV